MRPLRIAQIAPVAAPVRPGAGDSVEQLVSLLTEELVRRGHDVTLYATRDSQTSARLRSVYERGYDEDHDEPWEWRYREVVHAAYAWEHAAEHDLLHLHDFHWGLPFASLSPTPVVETPHTELPPEVLAEYRRQDRVHVAAVSAHQARALTGVTRKSVVPHGIDVGAFPAGEPPGDHLLFLGRLIPDKGPAEAIAIARAAGMPLVLAGPATEQYDPAADPEVDGQQVRWVGRVDAAERNRLMAGAAALVFPLRYPEPFGLVVIEAMACGTPVVATALGAVPELVEDGVTGFTARTWKDLAELVAPALGLDRAAIRREAEKRWDFRRMVDDYEALYAELAAG